jgi:transmembrane sensor
MSAPTPFRSGQSAAATARIETIAADWLARREAGLSADEQAEFSRWLLADPRHAAIVEEIQAAWHRLQEPRFTGQADSVVRAVEAQVRRRAKRLRRRVLTGAVAASLAMAAAVAFFPRQATTTARERATTSVVVKPERRTLADGSVVELNTGAEIAVDFSTKRRAVRLVRGEAHFAVTKDPSRPFVVSAGAVAVSAVGTEFSVQFAPAGVGVLVTEGRVAVERSAAPHVGLPTAADLPTPSTAEPAVTYLDAGTRLTVPAAASAPLEPVRLTSAETQAALAWRGMRVEFVDTPLTEAVALFNRQSRVQLALGAAELGTIRISGFFWADDPEGFSRLVESSASLRADRSEPGRITFSR